MRNHRMFCGVEKGRFVELETCHTRSNYFGTTWSFPPCSYWGHFPQVTLLLLDPAWALVWTRASLGCLTLGVLVFSSTDLPISWSEGVL